MLDPAIEGSSRIIDFAVHGDIPHPCWNVGSPVECECLINRVMFGEIAGGPDDSTGRPELTGERDKSLHIYINGSDVGKVDGRDENIAARRQRLREHQLVVWCTELLREVIDGKVSAGDAGGPGRSL